MFASITAKGPISHMHTRLREAFTAPSHTCRSKQINKERNTNGNFLACSKRHRDSCPDGKETNQSELDNMSDRTVMAAIVFTGDAAARLYVEGCVTC